MGSCLQEVTLDTRLDQNTHTDLTDPSSIYAGTQIILAVSHAGKNARPSRI